MAYEFKNKKFNAIENDKQTLKSKSEKTTTANGAFSGINSLNDLFPDSFNQNDLKDISVEEIDTSLIDPRSVNDFKCVSVETLKASIDNLTLFFPILLRKRENGRYTVISGHRRVQAVNELENEYINKKKELESKGLDTSEIDKKIELYKKIRARVFEVVADDSSLLNTNPRYITKDQEEEMYIASNAENRANLLVGKSGYIIIKYFYEMIIENKNLKEKILNESNKNTLRKHNKINYPKVISQYISKDLGYNVSPSSVWQLINIINDAKDYPKYQKKAIERIENGEKFRSVYNDYIMASKLHHENYENNDIKEEYTTRIEKGNEPIIDIYNEFYNIKSTVKIVPEKTLKQINRNDVINILLKIKKGNITIEEAIKEVNKF